MYWTISNLTTLDKIADNILESIRLKGYCYFELSRWGYELFNFREVEPLEVTHCIGQLLPNNHRGAVLLRLNQVLCNSSERVFLLSAVKMMGGLSIELGASNER